MSKQKYIFQVPPTLYGELEELKYKADKCDKQKEVLDKLQQENELLMTCSKAQMINKYIDELDENCKLSELWCKSQQENKQLKNNWNKLKKWLEEQDIFITELPAFTKEITIEHKTMSICYENILDKMQELEGSDD